jgi:phage-related protein
MVTKVTRPISWISAARKAFSGFPDEVRAMALDALTVASDGAMATVAKPIHSRIPEEIDSRHQDTEA